MRRRHEIGGEILGTAHNSLDPIGRAYVDKLAIKFKNARRLAVAKFLCATGDQVKDRLGVVWRTGHRLEHIEGVGLLLDPLAIFAVALSQLFCPPGECLG